MTSNSPTLDLLINTLPSVHHYHSPETELYQLFKTVARNEIEKLFLGNSEGKAQIKPFGEITLPYFKMGNIDSLNLFDLDELMIFSYYRQNRNRYKNVLDIGANIGLHTIILGSCGFNVRAFEPDPVHFEKLTENVTKNGLNTVELVNAAVSSQAGELEFVRVLGNTTGSHLAGSKSNPYGDLERFMVPVVPIKEHLAWADLVKLDAEGHEKEIIGATTPADWDGKDAVIEISSWKNANFLFSFFKGSRAKLYSQKTNWKRVYDVDDMPFCHHEGSLFVLGSKDKVW